MNQYLISIDFASKLGWSIWDKQTFRLLNVGSFDFDAKEFKKEFAKSKFQQKMFEKVLFEQQSANKLVNKIFEDIDLSNDPEINVIVEYSDFGFKYAIERIMRLLACFFIELNEFSKHHSFKLNVSTMIAVTWRKAFTDNNTSFDYSKYETKSKNNRRRINWKPLAKNWSIEFIKNSSFEIDEKLLFNNDITDSILIGWTWLNWMDKNKLKCSLKPLITEGGK